MNGKELVLSAIRYEKAERTPVSVLDGYTWMMKQNGMSFQQLFEMEDSRAADFILGIYEELGSDMIFSNGQCSGAVKAAMGGEVDYSGIGVPAAAKKIPLAKPEDIRAFNVDEVFDKTVKEPVFAYLSRQQRLFNDRAGSEKLICSFGLGPLTMAAGMLGMQPLMMAMYEDPDEVKNLLDFGVELTIKMAKEQAENGATAISLADPLSSINLISDDTFAEFSLPGIKRICEEMKAYDKDMPIMLHICGNTTSRLAPLTGTGIDIFSVDSIDLDEAFRTADKDYALFGNLSTTEVMLTKTPEEIDAMAKERIAVGKKYNGFILAPGCDLAPDTPKASILAMTKAARE
ncbi:MAG: uroporphyrinogen decarboxylase family protein [Eubacterium sp.]|nr:uroporphyrinogen decarboxylase family protein [Eubacterium sp.]